MRSPSDVPDGSNNRMEDIPEGVLYGEHNDPSEERHLETQTEEEKEILEALSGVLDEDGEIKAEDRFPPLEHFYQDARSLEKEKRQEREKVKQLEHTMRRVKKVDRFGASLGTEEEDGGGASEDRARHKSSGRYRRRRRRRRRRKRRRDFRGNCRQRETVGRVFPRQ